MIHQFVRQMFVVLGTPYSEMEGWQRTACLKLIYIGECAYETAPYLSFVVLASLMMRDAWDVASVVAATWCITEILFHIYSHLAIYRMTKSGKVHVPMTQPARIAMAHQICDHVVDPDSELKGWLYPTPKGRLHVTDLEPWIVWGFFGKTPDEITDDEQEHLREITDIFAAKLANPEPLPCTRPKTYTLRPTLDTLDLGVKSLFMYTSFSMLKVGMCTAWSMDGFVWRPVDKGISYWLREPEVEDGLPILLLHGGGVGIYMYATQIMYLVRKYPTRRIIMFIINNACLAPSAACVELNDILAAADHIFATHAIDKVSVIAHSFGTMVAGFLVIHRPQYIAQLTFVDPICFMIFDSTFAFRSLYAQPTCLFHHIYYILSRDPVFASFLHNQWLPIFLFFPESISVPTNIYVAERDWIVDGRKTYKYLQDRKAKSRLDHVNLHLVDMTHGEYLYSMDRITRFSSAL